MYAIVKTGGKQVKLETGMTEVVEKLDVPVGGTVTFTPLFVSDDGNALVGGDVAGVTVTAEVVEQFKGDKQIVFKFKKRKGYKKLKGHRQQLTRIRVTGISLEGGAPAEKPAAKKAPAKPKAAETAAAAAVETVEAPAEAPATKPAAKAPAAKKPAAAKAPAAKKPAAAKAVKEETAAPVLEGEEKPKPRTRKPAAKKETPADESAE